jgi:hypothetical protein
MICVIVKEALLLVFIIVNSSKLIIILKKINKLIVSKRLEICLCLKLKKT